MKTKNPIQPPKGWGDDELTNFFEQIRGNQFATFANKPGWFQRLKAIDACFLKIGKNLINPKEIVAALLLLRSHAAYRGACGTACAGQVAETFMLLRGHIEYAGYALLIFQTPGLGETWLKRHDDKASLILVRNSFPQGRIRSAIESKDRRLAEIYTELYERFIDFGAHPNERAVTGSMIMEEKPEEKVLQQIYLHGDGLSLDHALKSSAQAGLCALHIFQFIFLERFNLLGITAELKELRKHL